MTTRTLSNRENRRTAVAVVVSLCAEVAESTEVL
jgi:hypothetical protein